MVTFEAVLLHRDRLKSSHSIDDSVYIKRLNVCSEIACRDRFVEPDIDDVYNEKLSGTYVLEHVRT